MIHPIGVPPCHTQPKRSWDLHGSLENVDILPDDSGIANSISKVEFDLFFIGKL